MSANRPAPLLRDGFRHFETLSTRCRDNDIHGRLHNIVHLGLFDTAVNRMLIPQGALDIQGSQVVGLDVHSQCIHHDSSSLPQTVHAGIWVALPGRTSVRYELALFADQAAPSAAPGEFTHVDLDRTTQHPKPLPEKRRAVLESLKVNP